MPQTDKDTAKIVRFYSNITGLKPDKVMDIMTIEDLKEAGFVNYRYQDAKDPETGVFWITEVSDKLVHESVPVAKTKDECNHLKYDHPTIRHELGYGWEAKWGAARFPLRNADELRRFMNLFDYKLPQLSDGKAND